MSPQTLLDTNSRNNCDGGTVHTSISSTTTITATTASATLPSASLSSSLCVRTNNLPASLTITATASSANTIHGNKTKHHHHTSTKTKNNCNNNNTATLRSSNLPTLQWPWSTTTTTTTAACATTGTNTSSRAINTSPASAALSLAVSCTASSVTGSSSATVSNISIPQAKKRTIAPYIAGDTTSTTSTAAKKFRITNNNGAAQDATHINTLTNHTNYGAKRLKAAALEESQTKITGYFKSQMKVQMQSSHSKSSNVVSTESISSSSSSSITTNALTMSAPATTASLNKYFNILAQLKDNNKQTTINGNIASSQVNNTLSNNNNNNLSAILNTSSVPSSPSLRNSGVSTVVTTQLNLPTVTVPTTASTFVATNTKSTNNVSMQPVSMPALKKIERPKPTKIAQVAPNLRKTPSTSQHSYNHHSSSMTGKSPAKKHVAIAPRTPEMKQQMQHQQQLLAIKQDISKQQLNILSGSASAAQSVTNLTQANSAPQPAPAVLLTAIRMPTAHTQAQQSQLQNVTNKPTLATNKLTQNTNSAAVVPPPANAISATPAATLYQLPTVQLPNLVQVPQLLAASGANIMQLNSLAAAATMAKNAQTNVNNTGTTNATHSTQQAAQAAAAQYFLNGTVFKLQQFTTATTTTATSAATNTVNPFNFLSAADLQDILIKQQQQQQQLQQLQQQKTNLSNLTAASANSFQEIFQQQIAAAIAANQQQAQLQQLQRLGAAANIQQQPVFMATPAGLLLNAASLPAMLAQAAAALAVNNHQQQQQQKALTLPALQPIQSAPLPALSSIFAPQQQQTGDQQQQELQHQQMQQLALSQQQFINSNQPPPLATVALTTTSQQQLHHPHHQHQQPQQMTHSNNISNITTNSNNLQSSNQQQQLNAPLMGATVAPVNTTVAATTTTTTHNTAKLAIVKANNNVLPNNYTTLSSQPPPLVTISNRTHKGIICHSNSSKAGQNANKPYQKRSTGSKLQNLNGKSVNKTQGGKIATASGKIIVTPTTPPPLVPTMTTTSQQQLALSSTSAKLIRNANLKQTTNSIMPTPALVSISSTNTTAVQPKATQSLGGSNSITISPVVSTVKSNQLVNIAPKLTVASATQNNTKQGNITNLTNSAINSAAITPVNMTTNISTSHVNTPSSITKTKANVNSFGTSSAKTGNSITTFTPTTSNDLFDLVKNSNGAISITTATTAPFNLISNFPQNRTNLSPSNKPLETLNKIKVEPLDDQINHTVNKEKEMVKIENPTSFSGQLPCNLNIKEELVGSAGEETEKSLSPQPNNILNNECSSSSSFSSNSISVSSAADLSLEASTPASITSSDGNSPQCLILSPLNNICLAPVTPNLCSNSVSDSNSLNSCAMGASSRDMLSEMVTSTCISSDYSEASISVSLPQNEESKLSSSEEKSASSTRENGKQPRDVPTPESGIGGSLSNIESMDSSSKSSTEEILSSASSSDSTASESVHSPEPSSPSDSQTPPSTPMIQESQNNEESQNETSSTASSLCQSHQSQNINNSKSTSSASTSSSLKSFDLLSTTIDTKLAETLTKDAPKCAISPILSQPKTIRFPANGGKGNKRQDGVCYWTKCNKKHDSNSKLLDHMQHQHVNTQTGPFSCLWVGCKVYQKESCSRRWLERHVLSHGGSKQFKCIVEGCGLRFGSQLALQKHVNNHFTATEHKESTSKRTSDPPVPKQLRKNGKKLRYRRQPFSARMFDFFDAGIMEGLQHRLRQISTLSNGCNAITFKGHCVMKRRTYAGNMECFVQWSPREIISDEWLRETAEPFEKTVSIKQMKPAEKIKVESLLMASYKMAYSPTIFENDYSMSQQYHGLQNDPTVELSRDQTITEISNKSSKGGLNIDRHNVEEQYDEDDIAEEEDDYDDDNEEDAATTTETVSSCQNVLTIMDIQKQQHKKHPRKPQNRMVITR